MVICFTKNSQHISYTSPVRTGVKYGVFKLVWSKLSNIQLLFVLLYVVFCYIIEIPNVYCNSISMNAAYKIV